MLLVLSILVSNRDGCMYMHICDRAWTNNGSKLFEILNHRCTYRPWNLHAQNFGGIMHAYKEEYIFFYISAVECFQPVLSFKVAVNLNIACLFSIYLPSIHLIAHLLITVKCCKKVCVCMYQWILYSGSTKSEKRI